MESTAYATGKSMVALHIAGLPASHPAYRRGIKLLLKTQQEDGSWYVQTRALAFQPWFDAGFPHDHDQWISAAGTNWAAMALACALPTARINTATLHRKSPAAPNASGKNAQPSDAKRVAALNSRESPAGQ